MRLVFLDRDGVISRFPGKGKYVTKAKQLRVLANAFKGLKRLTDAGYHIHVISNQGSVSRGLITRQALLKMTRAMLGSIRRHGGRICGVHYCLHQTADHCRCKKPKTLLLKKAARGYKGSKKDIYFVGDSEEDIRAGRRFGCRTILVLSGRNKKKDIKYLSVRPDLIKRDLNEAAAWITKKKS